MKDPKKWQRRPWTDLEDPTLPGIGYLLFTMIVFGYTMFITIHGVDSFINWDGNLAVGIRSLIIQIPLLAGWFFATYEKV